MSTIDPNFSYSKKFKGLEYSKLYYWNAVARGGHFVAFEQPEIFVAKLRKSFAQFR